VHPKLLCTGEQEVRVIEGEETLATIDAVREYGVVVTLTKVGAALVFLLLLLILLLILLLLLLHLLFALLLHHLSFSCSFICYSPGTVRILCGR